MCVFHNVIAVIAVATKPAKPIHPSPSRSGPSIHRSATSASKAVPVRISIGSNATKEMFGAANHMRASRESTVESRELRTIVTARLLRSPAEC